MTHEAAASLSSTGKLHDSKFRAFALGLALVGLGASALPAVLVFVESPATFYFVLLAGSLAAYAGIRVLKREIRCRSHSAEVVLEQDPRPPVLYLRPFVDDHVFDEPPWWIWASRFIGPFTYGLQFQTIEEKIVTKLSRYGPVIAVGQPGEAIPPIGAARLYLDHAVWKSEIAKLMRRAQLVVLFAGASRGLLWELQALVKLGALEKVLMIVPFDGTFGRKKRRQRYEAFRKGAEAILPGMTIETYRGEPIVLFTRQASDGASSWRAEWFRHRLPSFGWFRVFRFGSTLERTLRTGFTPPSSKEPRIEFHALRRWNNACFWISLSLAIASAICGNAWNIVQDERAWARFRHERGWFSSVDEEIAYLIASPEDAGRIEGFLDARMGSHGSESCPDPARAREALSLLDGLQRAASRGVEVPVPHTPRSWTARLDAWELAVFEAHPELAASQVTMLRARDAASANLTEREWGQLSRLSTSPRLPELHDESVLDRALQRFPRCADFVALDARRLENAGRWAEAEARYRCVIDLLSSPDALSSEREARERAVYAIRTEMQGLGIWGSELREHTVIELVELLYREPSIENGVPQTNLREALRGRGVCLARQGNASLAAEVLADLAPVGKSSFYDLVCLAAAYADCDLRREARGAFQRLDDMESSLLAEGVVARVLDWRGGLAGHQRWLAELCRSRGMHLEAFDRFMAGGRTCEALASLEEPSQLHECIAEFGRRMESAASELRDATSADVRTTTAARRLHDAGLLLASVHRLAGEWDEEFATYVRIASAIPDDLAVRELAADRAEAMGRNVEALAFHQQAIELHRKGPVPASPWRIAADEVDACADRLPADRVDGAQRWARTIMGRPQWQLAKPAYHVLAALRLQLELGQLDAALRSIEGLCNLSPQPYGLLAEEVARRVARYALGDAAVEIYRQLSAHEPESMALLKRYVEALMDSGSADAAELAIRQFRSANAAASSADAASLERLEQRITFRLGAHGD